MQCDCIILDHELCFKRITWRYCLFQNVESVWKDLAERYDKVDGSRIFQLHKEIATVSQGTSSISTYFSRLRELWVEYDSLTPVPSCECVNSREFVKFVHNRSYFSFLWV